MKLIYMILLFILSSSYPIYCATNFFTNNYMLDKIVVTATRYPHSLRKTVASVTVIDEEEIRLHNANNVVEVLNFESGVLTERTGLLGRNDLSIRGRGNKGTMVSVLVDGRPDKMGLFGCAVTHSLPLDNVERIEVIRGPASVLYGSDAVAGIMNVITKIPKKQFEGDVKLSYGSFQTRQGTLRLGGLLNKWSYYFSGTKIASEDFRPNTDFNSGNISGKIGYALSKTITLNAETKYFKGKKTEPGLDDNPLNNYTYKYERSAVDFTVYGNWKNYNNFLKIYRNYGNHNFTTGYRSKDFINGFIFQNNLKIIDIDNFTVGYEYKQLGGEKFDKPSGKWQIYESAPFVYNQIDLTRYMIFSQGLRYTIAPNNIKVVSPQLGIIVFPWTVTKFRIHYNKGFRSPQINELYIFPVSNKNLKPEKYDHFELGVNQIITKWVYTDISFYYMDGHNIIIPVNNKLQNSGHLIYKGIENSFNFIITKNFNMTVNYTHNDYGENTVGHYENKVDLKSFAHWKKFSISLMGQFINQYYADNNHHKRLNDFAVFNSKLVYHLFSYVETFLEINNLTNTKYELYVNLPEGTGVYVMPGINFNTGVTIKF